MRNKVRLRFSWRIVRAVFGRLFSFWSDYRRIILVVLISLVLVNFLASLEPETRRVMFASLLAQRALVMLLLVFNLLTLSLLWSAGQRLDIWVFTMFNLRGHHPLWLDRLMWIATQIGNGMVGLLLGITLYFSGSRRVAIELLLGILSLWLAVELTKAIVERTRPFHVLEGSRVIGWREIGKSFPSGHTAQAFFMATMLSRTIGFGSLTTGVLYSLAALVAITRIYVGAHYPRDVIGGAILGSVWGILTGLVELYLKTGQF
jgi:membrane-associated phospholipid phosphatase